MIKSMTGFAAVTREAAAAQVTVTAKSVNHRFLDVQIRTPAALAAVDAPLRALIQRRVARGRVELTATARFTTPPPVEVDVNEPLMATLAGAASDAVARGWAKGPLTPGDLLRCPQVVTRRELADDADAWAPIGHVVLDAADAALGDLDRMRQQEGRALATDLETQTTALRQLIHALAAAAEAGNQTLQARWQTRAGEIAAREDVDQAVVAQELVRWIARSDIHEEVARLHGHLDHVAELCAADAPCGRKLDFLAQELHREVNTIGSKAAGPETGARVVDAKVVIERLREQVQNVE